MTPEYDDLEESAIAAMICYLCPHYVEIDGQKMCDFLDDPPCDRIED